MIENGTSDCLVLSLLLLFLVGFSDQFFFSYSLGHLCAFAKPEVSVVVRYIDVIGANHLIIDIIADNSRCARAELLYLVPGYDLIVMHSKHFKLAGLPRGIHTQTLYKVEVEVDYISNGLA